MPEKEGPFLHKVVHNSFESELRVSRSRQIKSKKRFRALIKFSPRQSHFDINNQSSVTNEFRGFFSLFWVSICILTMQVYVRGIESRGRPLDLALAYLFSQDAFTLALSDAALILSTGLCIPIALALKRRWIRYYWAGLFIQHLFQTIVLFTAIIWTFNRKWPWVQSGFLTLHSLVLIMKTHSYLSVNGHFQQVAMQSDTVLNELRREVEAVGSWDEVVSVCTSMPRTNKDVSKFPTVVVNSVDEFSTTPTTARLEATKSNVVFRNRTGGRIPFIESSAQAGRNGDLDDVVEHILLAHPLVNQYGEQIAQLAMDYFDLQSELTSSGPNSIKWPKNICVKDFVRFHMFPTLVYELEYPRTNCIRPLYVFEKTVGTFGTMALLYTVTEQFIIPNIPTSEQSVVRSMLDLALPFMIAYLLLFYIIFECICNAFAEISLFADRQFYEDWCELIERKHRHFLNICRWNSTSWDEFSRKWNKPVYMFLLRHVYAPPVFGYGMSKTWAMSLTIVLSACVHELVMAIVTKKLRVYIFALQIFQIPMILISRLPFIKRNKLLGNLAFWLSLYTGFPLLCVAYVTY